MTNPHLSITAVIPGVGLHNDVIKTGKRSPEKMSVLTAIFSVAQRGHQTGELCEPPQYRLPERE